MLGVLFYKSIGLIHICNSICFPSYKMVMILQRISFFDTYVNGYNSSNQIHILSLITEGIFKSLVSFNRENMNLVRKNIVKLTQALFLASSNL